jgi:glycosyltransferase involved in cell wall biosynthesis
MSKPFVSVIVPCWNEIRFIEKCLDTVIASTYPADRMEVLVVDGRSDDGTRKVITSAAAKDRRITLIENPRRTAPAAMNIGIARARGDVIMRMDAHCEYPPDYIPSLVSALETTGAANVGGVTSVVPAANTPVAKAIAVALSHAAGMGDSHFRIGAKEARWVDTVPFGCWKRETFERVGLFDESLPRNQDDEFNMRLARSGGRILLVPTVVTRYFGRETLAQLRRMFYQYGYFKPLTAIRSGSKLRPRQYAPAALVLGLAVGALLLPLSARPLSVVLIAYAFFVAGAALPTAMLSGAKVGAAFLAVLPTMHLSYGLGFLRGTLDFAILKRAPAAAAPKLSR